MFARYQENRSLLRNFENFMTKIKLLWQENFTNSPVFSCLTFSLSRSPLIWVRSIKWKFHKIVVVFLFEKVILALLLIVGSSKKNVQINVSVGLCWWVYFMCRFTLSKWMHKIQWKVQLKAWMKNENEITEREDSLVEWTFIAERFWTLNSSLKSISTFLSWLSIKLVNKPFNLNLFPSKLSFPY
jgi:hypothetical protein